MKKKLGPGGMALFATIFIFILAACTPKQVKLQVEEQGLQIRKADDRIADLEKSNADLSGQLKGMQASRDEALTEKNRTAQRASALTDEVSNLKTKIGELEKSIAAASETETQSVKRIRGLTGQVGAMRKDLAEKDEMIAAKDYEIEGLQNAEAEAKAAVTDRDQRISGLNAEKSALAGTMEEKLSGKNTTVIVLAVLLGVALISLVVTLIAGKRPIG